MHMYGMQRQRDGEEPTPSRGRESKVESSKAQIENPGLEEMFGMDRMSIGLRSRLALCASKMCEPEPSQR
eukprot:2588013-Rhodomonas_salina.1